jgi:hypothetical protein
VLLGNGLLVLTEEGAVKITKAKVATGVAVKVLAML